ncbi:titin [Drosophila serrata]|uniref:titin n=1 Tax=Drosophila serrata TaxID=7274 RepID=UPI000A1D19B9|nr:titin [Drosophila serrata]
MIETKPEERAGEEQRTQQTQSISQAAANNTNNSQHLVNQEPESAVFCLSIAMATAPEVLGMTGQFPVGRGITWGGSNPMNHHQPSSQGEHGSRNSRLHLLQVGKFPLIQDIREHQVFPLDSKENIRFPLSLVKVYTTSNQGQPKTVPRHQVYAPYSTPCFPLHQVYAPLHHGFPQMIQLGNRKNSGDAVPHISITMTRRKPAVASSPPIAMAPQEFPIIKKQFVSFPNYRTVANEDGPKTTPATTTVTQRGPAKVTEIDEGGVGGVHKVFDNEPEAERRATATAAAAALNLNVVEAVAKEIEHQQAENLNDAFGQRHDYKGRVSDDAMDVDVAKNKREICEQSKLEKAEDHNELNMTENLADQEQQQQRWQRQSICLAREQTIDGDGYGYGNGKGNHQQRRRRWQLSGELSASDARESSPEQVDVNNLGRQQLTRERNRTQNCYRNPCPNIESLKSSVRAFLADSSPIDWDWDCDWELLELLTNAIELLCAAPADTGNLWSEEAVQAGADMTVSQVSEERETETVDVYPAAAEQLDQPLDLESELDNNNNNSSSISATITEPIDMKYSTSTASRIPRTEVPQPAIQPSSRPSATSRIRDVAGVQGTTRTTTTPLLGELKRSSTEASSIDTDSVLPERTRLRRQRRMRSQDSVEEKPEDVIERINKLKARISGALSEVKGVLKQYSTESEAEGGAQETPSSKPSLAAADTAPVSFRFVTKVRRRSYFDEAEEEKEQAQSGGQTEATKDKEKQSNQGYLSVPQKDNKIKREQTPFAFTEKNESSPNKNLESKEKESVDEKQKDLNDTSDQVGVLQKENQAFEVDQESKSTGLLKSKEIKEATKEPNEKSEKIKEAKHPVKNEKVEDATTKSNFKEVPEEPPKVNGELPRTDGDINKVLEKSKSQTKLEFLAKVQSELKSKSVREASRKEAAPKETIAKERSPEESALKEALPKETTPKEVTSKKASLKETTPKEEAHKAALPKEETPKETTSHKPVKPELVVTPANDAGPLPDESAAVQPPPKIKKKVIVKAKNPRRASIAAVEPSKIKVEPAVEQIDALIIQRRPSDSETIVKRKKKLKLMGAVTSPTTSPPAAEAAAKSTTSAATTSGNRREATPSIAEEQLATPEVTSVAAKSASAKSDQGEATTPAAEAVTTAAATPTEAIDGNLAPAGNRSRRASLKLAELVGETVLVVPAPHPVPAAVAATEALPPTKSKEPINQETQLQVQATPQQVAVAADIAPQIATTLRQEESSPEQQPEQQAEAVEATKVGEQAPPGDSLAIMPELKVLAGPVQPVKIETVEQPHDEAKGQEPLVKKKAPSHLKKLVRKNSIDKSKDEHQQDQKQQDSTKLSNILRDKNKINELSSRINKLTPPKKQAVKQPPTQPKEEEKKLATEIKEEQPTEESSVAEEAPLETEPGEEPETEPAPEPEPAPKPKKPRKIKKKVIIKRQKRRLSIGDTFFLQPEPEEPTIPEIETIERAIAYVTDDEEEEEEQAPEEEPSKALKSCMHVREYKIGDLVLYAERFRKTQVRWKRGRVLERITSISYKLEIEGKEVPAHVSYIKKYTGRKVRFGGKEYLEIDYEQVAEEERRAASYSIWNMV